MKIVLDASVLVAAFATHGLCEAVFELCLESHEILISNSLLDEVRTSLRRRIQLPSDTVENIINLIRENGTLLAPATVPKDSCRDPKDLHILGLAVAGAAEYVVTGDKDLLDLGEFRGCGIVSPRGFSDLVHRTQ